MKVFRKTKKLSCTSVLEFTRLEMQFAALKKIICEKKIIIKWNNKKKMKNMPKESKNMQRKEDMEDEEERRGSLLEQRIRAGREMKQEGDRQTEAEWAT